MPAPVLYRPGGSTGGGSPGVAANVSYTNSESGLDAENVQDAIDELVVDIAGGSGTLATDVRLIDGNYTITADDWDRTKSGSVFTDNWKRILHATPANAVVVTFPVSSSITAEGQTFTFYVDEQQTGAVTFVPANGGTINGKAFDHATPTQADGPGSWVTVTVKSNAGSAPVMIATGSIRDAVEEYSEIDFKAQVTFSGGVANRVLATGFDFIPPATTGAAPATRTGGSTPAESSLQYFAFDDTTREYLYSAPRRMPTNFVAANGITAKFFHAAVATTGNAGWDVALRRLNTAEDYDSAHTYSAQSATVAVPATAGALGEVTVTFTSSQIDSLAAGEPFIVQVSRNPGVGSDATGDVYFVPSTFELLETAT